MAAEIQPEWAEAERPQSAPGVDMVRAIVKNHGSAHGGLIGILQEIQAKYLHLPVWALKIVAAETGMSLVDVYGAATFYKAFTLSPRGRHLVSACQGTACHVRGSPAVVSALETELGVEAGGTTADREFTFQTVNCLGACALGPVVVVDGHYFPSVGRARVPEIVESARNGLDHPRGSGDPRLFPVELACPRCNHTFMDPAHPLDGRPSVRVSVSFGERHGWLRLSALYGSFAVESEHEIPLETVAHFFCPHCHAELAGTMRCADCGAHMVPMIVRGGGMVQICARRGCRGHLLNLGETSID